MISIVIPIFNEEENLNNLYTRLTAAAPSWQEDYEIVLVDDGSADDSLQIMTDFAEKDTHVRVVKLSRNFGHQPAISAGIQEAKGDAVVIMDGDLQDPPEELHRFLEKWREGYHVVYAVRTKRKEGFFKKLAYRLFYRLLAAISEIDIPLDSGDFCVMDRKVVNAIVKEMPEQIRFVRGLRAYAGFKQIGVEYERAERAAGEVKYTFKKLMGLAMDGLFGFSNVPLRLATYFGFMIAIPSFIVGIFFILHRLIGFKVLGHTPVEIPGTTTLTVGMYFLGGVTLIILGILGEYIGRIYIEVKRRPFFVIDEVIEKGDKS
ncbi:glycosyltransferase family 2 protein [Jiulongibacter sediminis]|uniref:Glycosyl transferase n=1 Tax=Jiulongibacter sediminis TaxID=1605367 RepID=A0A0P7BUK1_9BACT|nr:glycosyltransferase family 2 protein [Jiulongibacter sediminis]KPM48474.1 glycosyl transferase [Jiulongibacter sediminis]TBX25013.1 glycosyl transferase [Jiulongibacter sediminis]